jgi:hypothetical protein
MVIAYVLNNPVRAGLAGDFRQYSWSSSHVYFGPDKTTAINRAFVEGLFGSQAGLDSFMVGQDIDELPILQTGMGAVVGGESFLPEALKRADRR